MINKYHDIPISYPFKLKNNDKQLSFIFINI